MNLSPMLARVAYALLAAIVTFVLLLVVGAVLTSVNAEAGHTVKQYASIIAVLVGICYFLFGPHRTPNL